MTALAAAFGINQENWKRRLMPLGPVKAWKGATACGDTATGKVTKGQASATLVFLGVFAETVDNTANVAGAVVDVDFLIEREILWRANDGTIAAVNLFSPCYVLDDQTVTLGGGGHSLAGTILAIDPAMGVAFEVRRA